MKKKFEPNVPSAPPLGDISTTSTVRLTADDDYNPYEHREKSNQYSTLGALAHILKSSLGAGVLSMPLAFKHGGLVLGTVGTVLIGIMCTHTVHMLVVSAQTLCVRMRVPSMTMAQTAKAAFTSGPRPIRRFAGVAKAFVNGALFATYYFGLTSYVVLIAASIQQVVEAYQKVPDGVGLQIWKRIFIGVLVVPLVPIGMIRKLKHLVPLSVLANCSLVVGYAITGYYIFRRVHDPSTVHWGPSDLTGLPLFFSTAMFAMEGIGAVMPVENTMRHPKRMGGLTGIATIAMVIVVVLFTVIGAFGYLEYGESVMGSITLNLPGHQVPAQAVKILLAVAILFTYPLQLYVAVEILWGWLSTHVQKSRHILAESCLRTVLVLITIILALAVPNLGPIVSLLGSLFFSVLGLFIPAMVHTATFWEQGRGLGSNLNLWLTAKNGLFVALTAFAVLAGTYSSVLEIIDAYLS